MFDTYLSVGFWCGCVLRLNCLIRIQLYLVVDFCRESLALLLAFCEQFIYIVLYTKHIMT